MYMTMADLCQDEDVGIDIDSDSDSDIDSDSDSDNDSDSDEETDTDDSLAEKEDCVDNETTLLASSPCWRVFKACNKGHHETMHDGINGSEGSLLHTLQLKTSGDHSDTIIDLAINAVEKEDWNLPNFPTFQSLLPTLLRQCRCRIKPVPRAALQRQIQQWNTSLAALMTGESSSSSSTSTTWNQRDYEFEMSRRTTFRHKYIDDQQALLQDSIPNVPTNALRLFLFSLFEQTYVQYALLIEQ
jgi:hypothetical protein